MKTLYGMAACALAVTLGTGHAVAAPRDRAATHPLEEHVGQCVALATTGDLGGGKTGVTGVLQSDNGTNFVVDVGGFRVLVFRRHVLLAGIDATGESCGTGQNAGVSVLLNGRGSNEVR